MKTIQLHNNSNNKCTIPNTGNKTAPCKSLNADQINWETGMPKIFEMPSERQTGW